jgi:hypothetical protein
MYIDNIRMFICENSIHDDDDDNQEGMHIYMNLYL